MFPVLNIGPFALQTSGLVLLAGVWIGLSLAERAANRLGLNPGHIYNLAILFILVGIVGARMAFALRFPAAFSANPRNLLSINPGLLDPGGGILLGLIAGLIYGQRKKLPFWPTLDSLTPALATMSVAIGISHLATGVAYGAESSVPWTIYIWGAERHPTQIYEILAGGMILWIVRPGSSQLNPYFPGKYILIFLILYAGSQLLIEGVRGDSELLANGLRSNQLLAWVGMGGGLIGLWRLNPDRHRA